MDDYLALNTITLCYKTRINTCFLTVHLRTGETWDHLLEDKLVLYSYIERCIISAVFNGKCDTVMCYINKLSYGVAYILIVT